MAEQLVVFTLAGAEYALPVLAVREITKIAEVTPMPDSPPYIKGIINLRGRAIPIMDIHHRLGLPDDKCKVGLICEAKGITLGLTVDEVKEVSALGEIQDPPPVLQSQFVTGLINIPPRMVMVLDLDNLIGSSHLLAFKNLAG